MGSPGGCCLVFAPGPFTWRGGKRPIISAQKPELEQYLKSEFEGGGCLLDFRKKPEPSGAEPVTPTLPARPAAPPVRFEEPASDVRRTKPIRVPSRA